MVTSEEVAVIFERRAVGYPTVYQDGKVTNFYEQMIADIDFLLAERAKLLAVVEAAAKLIRDDELLLDAIEDLANTWSPKRKVAAGQLRQEYADLEIALAAYRAQEAG